MTDNSKLAQVGVVGLAVMGSNVIRSSAHKGYTVAVYNRNPEKTHTLIAKHGDEGSFIPSETIERFVASLERPYRALIMVRASTATDVIIDQLADVMEPDDVIINGGNSLYTNTIRHEKAIRARSLHYVGTDISGGEGGALTGPSIMPGDTKKSYKSPGPLLESISAHVGDVLCCTHISSDDTGHFVKMVHNGTKYADMRVIDEAYHLLHGATGLTPAEIADISREWGKGDLDSYLVEIAAKVLSQVDKKTGKPLVSVTVGAASQKDTGHWTVKAALDLDVPVTGIGEAVFAHALSSSLTQRKAARNLPSGNLAKAPEDRDAFVKRVRKVLYASKIVAYSRDFDEVNVGAKEYGWEIDHGALATIWYGSYIIRAQFLSRIKEAYDRNSELPALVFDEYFRDQVTECLDAWHDVVVTAAQMGIPAPVLSSSLTYYDGLRAEHLPTALVQGQCDYFGAHTCQRVGREGTFHTLWFGDRSKVEA